MELKGKRFLLVGGAGFIGSHVADALLRREVAEVRIYDDFSRGSHENLVRAIEDPRTTVFRDGADLLDSKALHEAMQDIDGVFHLAALWLQECEEHPERAFEVNVRGTYNVLDACSRCGVSRLVFSSSASVYGNAVETPMTESHPLDNTTFYGATKIAGEHLCRSWHHRTVGVEGALDFVGLRYMNVYGPRQDDRGAYVSVITRTLDRIARGESPIIHGDGSQAYDFVYVEDCAEANVLAMVSEETDAFCNVGTGTGTSVRELVSLLLDLAGSEASPCYIEGPRARVTNRVGCPERAVRDLGFTASIDLETGLRHTLEWHRIARADGRDVLLQECR